MTTIFGRLNSTLYEQTTPFRLANEAKFEFAHCFNDFKNITKKDVLIRYGMYGYSDLDMEFDKIINRYDSIKRAVDKLRSSIILSQNNIITPKIFRNSKDITKEDLPVLRRKIHHSRGTDIVCIRYMKQMVVGDYYSKMIRGTDEYRVHVFLGEVIRLQKKIREHGTINAWLHNLENGFQLRDTFKGHDIKLETELMNIAKKAVNVLGLDFGAVDILVSDEGSPYVLEVNTAPRLNKYGRQLYTIYFYKTLKIPFDLNSFSRVRMNNDNCSNGLKIEFRDILKKEEE